MDLCRSAKLGDDWGDYELMAYNISIVPLLPDDFFPTLDPPLDHIDPAILDSSGLDDEPPSIIAARYLRYLYTASTPSRDNFVFTFAAETLRLLDFDDGLSSVVIDYHQICLTICGKTVPPTICDDTYPAPQAYVCILNLDPTLVLLVLVVDKTPHRIDPAPQVIAGAIAAFQFNNEKRREHNLEPLDTMTIPCVSMAETRPTFYLVPVTTALSDAVISGTFPSTPTEAHYCPTVTTHTKYMSVGAEDREYRKLFLRRFLAFKQVAKKHWKHILEGV